MGESLSKLMAGQVPSGHTTVLGEVYSHAAAAAVTAAAVPQGVQNEPAPQSPHRGAHVPNGKGEASASATTASLTAGAAASTPSATAVPSTAASEEGAGHLRCDLSSRTWITYRNNFPALLSAERAEAGSAKCDGSGGKATFAAAVTSDAGWGCMLRTGQMLLAEALHRHHLGRRWRHNASSPVADTRHLNLLRLFLDQEGEEHAFSLHRMASVGWAKHQMRPGDWYGPTSLAHVLRDLTHASDAPEIARSVRVVVNMEGVVYRDTVKAAADGTLPGDERAKGPLREGRAAAGMGPRDFATHNPLLSAVNTATNGPLGVSGRSTDGVGGGRTGAARMPWKYGVLVLLPLRFGLDRLTEDYCAGLTRVLSLPQSVGFIGGRPRHSLYFVGYDHHPAAHQRKLLYLDPHTVQRAVPAAAFPDELRQGEGTYHYDGPPPRLPITSLDPSLALGFYFGCDDDFERFREASNGFLTADGALPLFAVGDIAPSYGTFDEDEDDDEALLFALPERDVKEETEDGAPLDDWTVL